MLQFEDIASEEKNQEDDNLIHLEEEVLPNAEVNSEVEHPSRDKEARLEEEEMTEAEEESLNERSVPAEVIENQRERERGMEQIFVLPKVKTRIIYRLIDYGTWTKGVVHSKSGKDGRGKAGRHRNCLSVKDEASDKIKWYDFGKDIEEWSLVEEEVEQLLLTINCQDKKSLTLIFIIARTRRKENHQKN